MRWIFADELTADELRILKKMRTRSRFFGFMRAIRASLFNDDFQHALESVYAPRGQNPVPPALLAMVTLLQAYTGSSDAEAVEASALDLRWQLVLGTLGQEDMRPFGQGSLVRFRARMAAHELDRMLLERTVDLARESGAFCWKKLRVAMDSSPLVGAGRVEDSWNLIGHAVDKLVRVVAKKTGRDRESIVAQVGLTMLEHSSIKAGLDIDWSKPAAKERAINRIISQARKALSWAQEHLSKENEHDEIVDQAIDLVATLIEQNTEKDPNDAKKVRPKKGVAADRICSVDDVEMRHGRKSVSRQFNGYKRHIASILTVPLILGACAKPANQPEKNAVPELIETAERFGKIDSLHIDRGYIAHHQIESLGESRTRVVCKPTSLPNKEGKFSKSEFKIYPQRKQVICPAGKVTTWNEPSRIARFTQTTCEKCPMATRCTSAKEGRTIQIHHSEALQQEFRRRITTQAGRSELRERVTVEHRLARIGQTQGTKARYKGTRKNTLDLRRHACVANLVELRHARGFLHAA